MNPKSMLANLGILICALFVVASLTTAQTASKPAKSSAKAKVLDLNSASKVELSALPGIGDEYAQKIIDARPYTAKKDLVSKNILPKTTFDKISNMVMAKKAATEHEPTKTGW